ncbi:hypothetical protein AVEN_9416-1 [Araneus ventricosus]|uniref:Uncharacterized protein n=1 Tax=Araneus ventricosus TaxID=182803 RepID=A0A4Y2DKW3_ARAVE|nr:hypothetical protein AVEN_9416-1 [Araneus ventricosus]
MNVSPQYRTFIEEISNGAEAWKKLKNHFQLDTTARVMALKHEFFSTAIEPDETIGLYASKLSHIIQQLRESGHPVANFDQYFQLLVGCVGVFWRKSHKVDHTAPIQLLRYLTTEYENIVQTAYRWEDKDFKFPKVLEILVEEARLRQRTADKVTVSMMSKAKLDPERTHISRSPKYSSKKNKFKGSILVPPVGLGSAR